MLQCEDIYKVTKTGFDVREIILANFFLIHFWFEKLISVRKQKIIDSFIGYQIFFSAILFDSANQQLIRSNIKSIFMAKPQQFFENKGLDPMKLLRKKKRALCWHCYLLT